MSTNYYVTQDMGFACYLLSNGVNLEGFNDIQGSSSMLEFVFNIPPSDEKLISLITKWMSDPEVKPLKQILYHSKVLKYQIKQHQIGKLNTKLDEEMY